MSYVIWWPKFVRSPGWDRGHDEESRNVRDVKIDILEGYIQTSERFRVIRVFFGVPESYGNSPGEVMCLNGPYGKGEKWRRKGEGGRTPNPLSNSDWAWEGRAPPPGSFPLRPVKAQYFSPYSRNSPVLRKISESLGTFPNSEYSRPIYRSLRLDHFETPRQVPNLIRDSELLQYINIHKLIIKRSS